MRTATVPLACFAILLLSACASNPVRLGSPSDHPVPKGLSREISATACGFQLLLLIPININNRQLRAYQVLAAQAGTDYITDIEVQEEWGYRVVGTQYCTTFRARALRAG